MEGYALTVLENHWPTGMAILMLGILHKHAVSRIDAIELTLNNGIRATLQATREEVAEIRGLLKGD